MEVSQSKAMHPTQNLPSSELSKLLDSYREFVETELYPIDLKVVQGPFRSYLPQLNELREKAKNLGLFAPHLDKESGGLDLSLSDFARVSEILGTSPLGHYVCNCQAPDIGNMELLELFGSGWQKRDFSPPTSERKNQELLRNDRTCQCR